MPPPNHFNAPILHKIVELYKLFHQCLKLFPKYEKYVLGMRIENTILEMLELSLLATYISRDKKEILIKLSNKIDFLKYIVRFACEIKCINIKKYSVLVEMIIEIGRMTGGWIKSK